MNERIEFEGGVPTFQERVKELQKNRDKIYKRMEEQAKDKEIQAYYTNPDNTPFLDIDNEIL